MTANDLSARLQDMLRLSGNNRSKESLSSTNRPLIQVVDDSAPSDQIAPNDSDDDDDDEPPPLHRQQNDATGSNEISLAERMMQHADEANKLQKREEDEKRRRNASKVNCKLNLDCPCIRCGSELVRNADLF